MSGLAMSNAAYALRAMEPVYAVAHIGRDGQFRLLADEGLTFGARFAADMELANWESDNPSQLFRVVKIVDADEVPA